MTPATWIIVTLKLCKMASIFTESLRKMDRIRGSEIARSCPTKPLLLRVFSSYGQDDQDEQDKRLLVFETADVAAMDTYGNARPQIAHTLLEYAPI